MTLKFLLSFLGYLLCNSIRLALSSKKDCILIHRNENYFDKPTTQYKFAIDLGWTILEIYLAIIVYFLRKKILEGEFQEIDGDALNEAKIGIALEVKGHKIKEDKLKNLKCIIHLGTQIKKDKANSNSIYFKVFFFFTV